MKIATYVKSTLAASALVLTISALPVNAIAESDFYQVVGVQSDDSLNIRAGAGTRHPVIGTIPFNGRTVMNTGRTQQVGNSTWAEVVWLGQIGWVNKRYLADSDQVIQPQNSGQTQQTQHNKDANTHTHPRNECTNSVTHTHPNGANPHQHHYSCDPKRPNQVTDTTTQQHTDANTHTHPRNECTNSVTHTHPNGANPHQHHYSCQKNAQPKYRPKQTTNDYYAIQ